MIVKALYIYPIKGLRCVSLLKSTVEVNGLLDDRRYMLADLNGQLISQRTTALLTQMIPERLGDSWIVSYKNDSIAVTDNNFSSTQYEVEVWGTRFMANEVAKETSEWFSNRIGQQCRLMVMPNKETRTKEFDKAPFKTFVSFADGYPVLTLGTASVALLNNKLKEGIPEDRFRANIILDTNTPHEEDAWQDFKIGKDAVFRNIKPCVRCQVITIDQETGEQSQEPNRTLASYRKFEKGICFGSNVIVLRKGIIQVGDKLELI